MRYIIMWLINYIQFINHIIHEIVVTVIYKGSHITIIFVFIVYTNAHLMRSHLNNNLKCHAMIILNVAIFCSFF